MEIKCERGSEPFSALRLVQDYKYYYYYYRYRYRYHYNNNNTVHIQPVQGNAAGRGGVLAEEWRQR